MAAYKAALNGQTRVVGAESVGGDNHQKGNGLVYALQALDGAIARGEYQQVLARWGAGRSGGAVGGQPAGDNLLTPSGMVCRVGERQISAYT